MSTSEQNASAVNAGFLLDRADVCEAVYVLEEGNRSVHDFEHETVVWLLFYGYAKLLPGEEDDDGGLTLSDVGRARLTAHREILKRRGAPVGAKTLKDLLTVRGGV